MADLKYANVLNILATALPSLTNSGQSAAIDITGYEGHAMVVFTSDAGSGTSPTLDLKLQSSDDNTTFSDVHSFSQVTDASDSLQRITFNTDEVGKYLRVSRTISGTSPSFTVSIEFIGTKKTAEMILSEGL